MRPDTGTNSLIITDYESRLPEVSKRSPTAWIVRTPQVSIQAKIIFVDRTDLQQLGLQYDLGSGSQFFNKLVQRIDPGSGDPYEKDSTSVVLGGNTPGRYRQRGRQSSPGRRWTWSSPPRWAASA